MASLRSSIRPALRSTTSPRLAVHSARSQGWKQSARRAFATEAGAAKGPSYLLYGLVGAGALGAGYYFTQGQGDDPVKVKNAASPKKVDYQAVYNAIAETLDSEDYDDGSYADSDFVDCTHASGTYDKETGNGGSNGATMRFAPEANHGANAGLEHARNRLEPIKQKFPEITYSDLWTLAGVCALQEMGGPYIQWRAGRQDGLAENCTPDGRLPDGDKGADHVRKIFYRMGFNDQEIVALSGAHALGRCHTDRSGFEGPWTFSPTTLTNDYYKLLLDEKWQFRKWKGPIQYEDAKTKSLMMLTTDYSLITDPAFKKYTEQYAKDESKFFDDFSKVITKLFELGVPRQNLSEPIPLKKLEDQGK